MHRSAVEGSGLERPQVSGGRGTKVIAFRSSACSQSGLRVINYGPLAVQTVPLAIGWRRKQAEQKGEISWEHRAFAGFSCGCVGSLQFAGVELTLGTDVQQGGRSFWNVGYTGVRGHSGI